MQYHESLSSQVHLESRDSREMPTEHFVKSGSNQLTSSVSVSCVIVGIIFILNGNPRIYNML